MEKILQKWGNWTDVMVVVRTFDMATYIRTSF